MSVFSPRLLFALLLSGSFGLIPHADAQDLNTGPIVLDVDPSSAGVFQLVAAFEPGAQAPVVTERATQGVQLAALQVPAGLPQPSIIIGRIAPGEEASFGIETLLPDTIAAFAFAPDDLETRASLKTSNPDLFRKLVQGGHVDPEESDLKTVLQTELKRMNCYRSSIDGDWGPGSRRSVPEYFGALEGNVTWSGGEAATMELFRAILLNGDVRCEAPVAAAPAPRPAASAATRTRTTTTTRPRTTAPRKTTTRKTTTTTATPQRKRRIGGGGTITR